MMGRVERRPTTPAALQARSGHRRSPVIVTAEEVKEVSNQATPRKCQHQCGMTANGDAAILSHGRRSPGRASQAGSKSSIELNHLTDSGTPIRRAPRSRRFFRAVGFAFFRAVGSFGVTGDDQLDLGGTSGDRPRRRLWSSSQESGLFRPSLPDMPGRVEATWTRFQHHSPTRCSLRLRRACSSMTAHCVNTVTGLGGGLPTTRYSPPSQSGRRRSVLPARNPSRGSDVHLLPTAEGRSSPGAHRIGRGDFRHHDVHAKLADALDEGRRSAFVRDQVREVADLA